MKRNKATTPAPVISDQGIIDKMMKMLFKNKNAVIGLAIVLVLLAAAYGIYTERQAAAYQQQWGDSFMAELSTSQDGDNPLANMEAFANRNKNYSSGQHASLMIGNFHYQGKNYPQAEIFFRQAMAGGNRNLAALAEMSLVATLIAQNLYDAAIAQSDAFLAKYPAHFATAQMMQNKALAQELSGRKEAAKTLYQRIQEDFPNTYYSAFAQLRLAEMK